MKSKIHKHEKNNLRIVCKKLFLVVILSSSFSFTQTISLQSFATGFEKPVAIANAGDSRLFIVEQQGKIKILNSNGTVNSTPFLDISSIVTTLNPNYDERGLLGLAFHPNYATNGYFFINYTNTSGNTVIARYSVLAANPNVANTTGTILMTINQPYTNHNGGSIVFGPDGYLYIGMGDGGSGGDPEGYSQNLTIDNANPSRVFLGKMLRINVTTSTSAPYYNIPPTNPYVGQTGKEEIWAIGLRNPWKFSFDSANGNLWIADVGQNAREEINRTIAPLPAGLNYGWRCYEGNISFNTTGCPAQSTLEAPFVPINHSTGACSINGGYVYRGTQYPNLVGKYIFNDYCDSRIGIVSSNGSLSYSTISGSTFVGFGEDVNKELYIISLGGTISKIVDTSLSSESFEKHGFVIFPNPAKEFFTLSNTNNIIAKSISIYDVTGKNVLTKNVTESNIVDITGFSKGIYSLTVMDTNDIIYNTKLAVQ